ILFFVSCSQKKNDDVKKNEEFKYSAKLEKENKVYNFSDLVSDYSYVKLQTDSNFLLGEIKQVISKYDRFYFVSDVVLCFDNEGRFLFKVGKKGRASKEYLSADFVSIDSNLVNIFDYLSSKIFKYDAISGEYIGELKLPYNVKKAVVSGNTLIMNKGLLESPKLPIKDKLVIAELSDPLKFKSYFPPSRKNLIVENELTYSNSNSYWINSIFSSVFKISNNQLNEPIPYFVLSNFSNNVSIDDAEKFDIRELSKLGKPVFLDNFMETLNHIYCNINLNNNIYTVLFNKQNNEVISYDLINGINNEVGDPIFVPRFADDNYLYGIIESFIIHEQLKDKKNITKLNSSLLDVTPQDNPV